MKFNRRTKIVLTILIILALLLFVAPFVIAGVGTPWNWVAAGALIAVLVYFWYPPKKRHRA